ncbi:uncharacterized protein LOC133911301 [Phragmites australis]|uniref:uncharacterized protein LOC133911301 n=1 Tax=Phragmites australis TaxID=29695 RepID=UPI002D770269|nr:uncharacterized protein LOC133911301 [Phragmites australis]
MALDESFKRPGSIPFKWEVQPGIPKHQPPGDRSTTATATPMLPPTTPRLATPPGARVSTLASASRPLSPPLPSSSSSSHRRSMSARFATSLVLPFTRRPRRGRSKDDVDFCVLYGQKTA